MAGRPTRVTAVIQVRDNDNLHEKGSRESGQVCHFRCAFKGLKTNYEGMKKKEEVKVNFSLLN